jgi:predicted Zn-dependent peptidase
MPKTIKSLKAPQRDVVRTVLANGVRVWSERVPRATTAAVGVWIDAGSRYEELKENGATHLLQRIALQGAAKRSADDIAKAIDSLGGDVSFATSRDSASWTARTATASIGDALSLLADLALRPKITQGALSAEQKALLEELRADEKNADFNLEHMFLRSFWKGHGLCRPPHGRLLTVNGKVRLEDFKLKSLIRFHRETHHPRAITVIVAGDEHHTRVADLAARLFAGLEEPKKTASSPGPKAYRFLALRNRPQFPGVRMQLGVPACGGADEQRHTAAIFNAVVGGGAGSRLARMVRAKTLPAAEVSSSLLQFADAGVFSVRLRAIPKSAAEALEATVDAMRDLTMKPIDETELDRAKATCATAMLARLDSPKTRIEDLADQERYFGAPVDMQSELAELENVTPAALRLLAAEWIVPHNLSLASLGNLSGVTIRPKTLRW